MADIPSNLSYGTVTGRFLLAYADSNDVGSNPDAVPAQGTVYFTPSPNYIKDATASPAPVTILPASIECDLDSEGYVIGYTGDRGVRLLATDDPQGNPVDWTWSVNFRLTDATGTPVRTIPDFSFELPAGTTVDLTSAIPVTDANGTFYLVGPAGPVNELTVGTVTTGAAGSSVAVTITGDAPDQTVNFTIPRGDTGVAATIAIGTTTTGAPGSSAAVSNSGTSGAAVFDFTVPQGPQGVQGIQGEVGPIGPTGATGITWQGTWSSGTDYVNNDAVFYNSSSWFASGNPPLGEVPSALSSYWYPLALQGATGPQGPAATISVGTVTTGLPSSSVTVTNVGTSGAAIFDFSIPKGDTGDIGNITATLPITYNSNTIGFDDTKIATIDGGTA